LPQKNEKFANAFAVSLLIPKEKIELEFIRISPKKSITLPDVVVLAEKFKVSKDTMLYRMLNTKLISQGAFNDLKPQLERVSGARMDSERIIRDLNSNFVRLVYLACGRVKISRSKAAKLLNIDLCDLTAYFNEYGFD